MTIRTSSRDVPEKRRSTYGRMRLMYGSWEELEINETTYQEWK
jgi:hypothetical protein